MQADEIKNFWKRLDESQSKQQLFNKQMLQQIIQGNATKYISTIANADTLGLIVAILVLLVFIIMLPALGTSAPLVICYGITILILLGSIALGFYRVSLLNKLDMGAMPVRQYQQQAEKIHLLTTRERLATIIISPVMIGCFYAVVTQFVKTENVFEQLYVHMPRIIAGIIAYIVLAIIFYNRYYFKNIQRIISNIREIEGFDR